MNYWSATRINAANYCRMRYYLNYVKHEKSLRISPYVKGSLLHEIIENFWERNGSEGEVLGKPKSKTKKYYDAESFAKYVRGKWMSIAIADDRIVKEIKSGKIGKNSKKQRIIWRSENEKWIIADEMRKICVPLYDVLDKEGPPLFSEMGFDFFVQGRRFKGRFDEIRKENGKIVIRDYKSGRPWIGEMKLEFDPQLTLYNVAICSLLFADSEFSKILGVSDEKRRSYMGNPCFTEPDFVNQFFMIEALKLRDEQFSKYPKPSHIYSTSRRDEHFSEFMNMISGVERAVTFNEIYPERGKKCDDCDMKNACKGELENTSRDTIFDSRGQGLLAFAAPAYTKKPEDLMENLEKIQGVQTKLRLRKKRKKKGESEENY